MASQDASSDERRSARRVSTSDWQCAYAHKKTFYVVGPPKPKGECPVMDIHGAGAQFLVNEKLARGDRLILRLTSAKHPTVDIDAEVAWAGHGTGGFAYRIGVCFTDYHGDSYQSLQDAISGQE